MGVDPLLDAPAFNGGATEPQALLLGSPAIDAGQALGCPATDQRGEPRPQGPACDIGAYEAAPPSAATGAASGVGTSGATLSGSGVNPELLPGHTFFQWGTTTSYGSQTTPGTIAAGGAGPFSAAISGLVPGTVYHFRAVVVNIDGASYGADATFVTGVFPLRLTRPTISALSETNSTFAVASRSTALHGVAASRHRKGTVFAFTLNQAATVRIAIQSLLPGRRVHGVCRAPAHKLRREPRCTRAHTLTTLVRTGHAGRDRVAFTGRLAGRALAPGHYRIVVTAADAGGTSAPRYLAFPDRRPLTPARISCRRATTQQEVPVHSSAAVARCEPSDALRFHSTHATPERPSAEPTAHIARGNSETRPSGACRRSGPKASGRTSSTRSP